MWPKDRDEPSRPLLVDCPLLVAFVFTLLAILAVTVGPYVLPADYSPGVAVLTLTLIAIVWYTYFTYRSTQVARESLQHAVELADYDQGQALDRLSPRVTELLTSVRSLPQGQPEQESQILGFNLWRPGDVDELEALAGRFGQHPARVATETATSLRWIYRTIDRLQGVDPRTGVRWDRDVVWPEWARRRELAEEGLAELLEIVNMSRAVKQLKGRFPRGWTTTPPEPQ